MTALTGCPGIQRRLSSLRSRPSPSQAPPTLQRDSWCRPRILRLLSGLPSNPSCVFKCCCIFRESFLRRLQVCGVGGQPVLVQSNVLLLALLLTMQTQTECRVPQPVQRLSSQSSWHLNSCGTSSQYRRSGPLHPIHHANLLGVLRAVACRTLVTTGLPSRR